MKYRKENVTLSEMKGPQKLWNKIFGDIYQSSLSV